MLTLKAVFVHNTHTYIPNPYTVAANKKQRHKKFKLLFHSPSSSRTKKQSTLVIYLQNCVWFTDYLMQACLFLILRLKRAILNRFWNCTAKSITITTVIDTDTKITRVEHIYILEINKVSYVRIFS